MRIRKLKLVVESFTWTQKNIGSVASGSAIRLAMSYAFDLEKYLRVFLSDGHVPLDNNAAEKNWMMVDTKSGAYATACIYSIVETAKTNNLKIYEYLTLYVLEEMSKYMKDLNTKVPERLMPWSDEMPDQVLRTYDEYYNTCGWAITQPQVSLFFKSTCYVTFIGIPVYENIIHEGWKHSMNPSMHPIFLTLDLNEIIAMTVGLVQCASLQLLFSQQYLSIARNIYNQLSDYAKGRIAHMIEMNDIQDYFLKHMSDEYRRKISDSIITMAKRDIPGRIMVSINDTDYVYNNCHLQNYLRVKSSNRQIS